MAKLVSRYELHRTPKGSLRPEPSNTLKLLGLSRETWQEISQDDIGKLISPMPKRVLALRNAKGMSIKYKFFIL